MEISREKPLPLYHQLKQHVLREIEGGEWPVGSVIPSELELANRFDVSRATVRQALLELVQTGHLHRVQGKGTIVTKPAEPKVEPIGALTSFSENMRAAGIEPSRKTLTAEWRTPPAEIADAMPGTADRAYYVERLLIADGIPLGIQRAWYPEAFVVPAESLFTREELDRRSIYDILQTQCGAILDSAEETLDVLMPTETDADLLSLTPESPIMLVHRNTFDPEGRLVESVQLYYRSDRYRYRVALSRARKGGRHESGASDDV